MAWRIQYDGTWFTYRNHSDKKTKRLEEARKAAIWYVYILSYLNIVVLPPEVLVFLGYLLHMGGEGGDGSVR